MAFEMHPRLTTDCATLCDLPLSTALLARDPRFHWVILVPRIAGLRDLHDVPPERRAALFDEIETVSGALGRIVDADKINVAALGNQVSQLHVHVIARRRDDPAWPDPVWSAPSAEAPLAGAELAARAQRIKEEISA